MNVNATLLVQMFNFFLSYLFIRVCVLRPLVQAVQESNSAKEQLRLLLLQEKEKLATTEHDHLSLLQSQIQYRVEHRPSLYNETKPCNSSVFFRNDVFYSHHELRIIVDQLKDELVNRLKRISS